MIPMSELVKDPVYKKFLQTKPELPPIVRSKKRQQSPPWVVYVQREVEGPWGKKEFWKYSDAFQFLKKCLKLKVHDAAINCKRYPSNPPTRFVRIKGKYVIGSDGVKRQATTVVAWKPKLLPEDPDHEWCRYCRRPTEFKYYRRHKALKGAFHVDPSTRRCCICGASERIALLPLKWRK